MARFKFLILGLLLACNISFAGYAQLKPPSGWSQGLGAAVPGQAGVFAYGAAANASSFKGSTVLTNAALNVAGQLVTVPVSMRVAANAASVAATYSFGNPYLFATALAVPLLYEWYKSNKLEVKDGVWKERMTDGCASDCYLYEIGAGKFQTGSLAGTFALWLGHMSSIDAPNKYTHVSCDAAAVACTYDYVRMPGNQLFSGNIMTVTRISVPPSLPIYVPVGDPEFHTIMDPKPLPNGSPLELPGVPLPVEQPVFNPDPSITPLPSPSPNSLPRPYFVPTGNPVPTPNPEVWNQPGVRISPSPSPDSPWQVDIQPENIPQNSPTPKTNAELNPGTGLPSTPGVPSESPGLCDQYPGIAACAPADKYDVADPAKDPAKIPGTPEFCAANPTALMCLKTDTPESDELETKDKTIAITPDSGWGSGGGSCPAPRHFSKGEFSFQIYCDFASGIKPVIIAVAWLVAAGILIGFKFGES